MKTTTSKTPAGYLPFRKFFTALLLLLLAGSLWSCELFDKDKTPEPTPTPIEKPVPDPKPNPDPQPNPTPPNPNPNPTPPNPGPVSNVPAGIPGKWFYGNFSMGEFWKYDGTYVGNAFEMGLAFVFKPDGECEFYLATGGTSFTCRTEAFVYKKGTVKFDNNGSFTFNPTEGSARGFYRGCASSLKDYNKKYTPQDLKPETYYYTLEKDSNGKDQLLIRFKPTDETPTIFRLASW